MKITVNRRKRIFTIEVKGNKYRTLTLSKAEFEVCEYNTPNDWLYYIRTQCVVAI